MNSSFFHFFFHFSSQAREDSRVLKMINDADLDGPNLTLPKAMLRRRPDIMVSTELVDMRMYIFSNWVIDYIVENEETISGITEDLLPSLLDMQFRGNQMYVSHALLFLVVDCCVVVLLCC